MIPMSAGASPDPSRPDDDDRLSAVMLGKIEVRLDQLLCLVAEQKVWFDEVWTRLRELELAKAQSEEWRRTMEARRPNWWVIVSMIFGILGFAAAVGIIGTKGV